MNFIHFSILIILCMMQCLRADLHEDGNQYERILEESWSAGNRYLSDLEDLERRLIENDIFVKEGTLAYRMSLFKQPNPQAAEISKETLRYLMAAQNISQRLNLLPNDWNSERGLFHQLIDRQSSPTCPVSPTCTTSKYRTADGSCNNLQRTYLGQAMTPLTRILPAAYSDNISTPRRATDGSSLASPRLISTRISVDMDHPSSYRTLAVMQWGQFTDHDLDSVPVNILSNGSSISCCTNGGQFLSAALTHPQCLPISIPADDYFFKSFNRVCMNFVRSLIGRRPDCTLGPADQLNELTHWIDGSQVYGSSGAKMNSLRSFNKGQLRTLNENGRDLLPLSDSCTTGDCFMAGDARVKEQPLLTVLHTVWMREHNRIAKALANQSPTWTDEKIFQETRRIVIAELQHITFNEWLPVILGTSFIQNYGLQPSGPGYFTGYNPALNASVFNEFAAAAFRMGHSLVQGFIRLFAENGSELSNLSFQLSSSFLNAQALRTNLDWLDGAIRGLINQPMQIIDPSVTTELTNKLFRLGNQFGFDLVSLNIQRGRDHGLPSYVNYRELFGLPRPKTFDDLAAFMPPDVAFGLSTVYKKVEDIDLFIGGLTEFPVSGSILGPVFSNIIAHQFSLLKRGDRFFYELGNQPHSFKPNQLNEIRKVSLARILCDNNDGSMKITQPWVFLFPDPQTNPRILCDSIPRVDLRLWAAE